jgi:hypothetical protein
MTSDALSARLAEVEWELGLLQTLLRESDLPERERVHAHLIEGRLAIERATQAAAYSELRLRCLRT